MTLERTISWILGALVALVLVTQVFSYYSAIGASEAEGAIQHTLNAERAIQHLLSALQDVETGYRGFVITGNESFLEPYHSGNAAAITQLGVLREVTRDSPQQRQRVAVLAALIERKLQYASQVISLRRTDGAQIASANVAQAEGKEIMDAIRVMTAQMQRAEETELTVHRNSAAVRRRTTLLAGAGAALILLAFAASSLWAVGRHTVALSSLNDSLRRTDATLRESLQSLEISNRDLQEFAMIASHDLQEPLRKIQMFGDRLQDDFAATLPAQGLDYLRRMQSAADRGQSLIQGLLDYSRVTTKGQHPVPIALGVVAAEVVSDLEARIQQSAGRVEIGELPTIEADPIQMRQLFQNLIGNALKFRTPESAPVIRIDAQNLESPDPSEAPIWELRVSDNGIGFDEKYLDRIFKIFQRLHERSAYEGAGMGLAICRRIIERHHGTITAQSTLGQGATFIITLPGKQSTQELNA